MKAKKESIEKAKKVNILSTEDPSAFIANKKYDVIVRNEAEYSCTCLAFKDNKGFPCIHIIAAAFEKKMKVEEEFNINISYYKELAKKYNQKEVMASLQKEIRKGKENESGWWAYCLQKMAGSYIFWRRMYIIAVEDCIAPGITIVDSCKKGFDWIRGRKDWKHPVTGSEMLFGIKAAIELARLDKDRMIIEKYSKYFSENK